MQGVDPALEGEKGRRPVLHFLSFICYLPAGQLPAPSLYLENIQYLFQLIR